MSRRLMLIFGILAALSVCCIGGIFFASTRASNTQATSTAVAREFLDPLRGLCNGQAAGVAGAGSYAAGAGIHPVVAFRMLNTTSYNRDTRVGTGDWSPKSLAETQLVSCAEETWLTVETCKYTVEKTGGSSTLNRLQHQVKLRLIAARTGEVLATQTLLGGVPRDCADTESFPSGTTSLSVSGGEVATTDIQSWMRPIVAP